MPRGVPKGTPTPRRNAYDPFGPMRCTKCGTEVLHNTHPETVRETAAPSHVHAFCVWCGEDTIQRRLNPFMDPG